MAMRWEGDITPPVTGDYTFEIASSDGASPSINGTESSIIFARRVRKSTRAKSIEVASRSASSWGSGITKATRNLLWAVPEVQTRQNRTRLIDRVRNDGTTLFILDRADTWMNLITNNTSATYTGSFKVGTAWLGGIHFVREHPLFKDLPVNQALDWPYQAVVRNGKTRSGLLLEGEELVAGVWHSYPMALGTAVGIIPCGKGKIVVSTLDIASQLSSSDTSAEVARKLLCNFILWAHP